MTDKEQEIHLKPAVEEAPAPNGQKADGEQEERTLNEQDAQKDASPTKAGEDKDAKPKDDDGGAEGKDTLRMVLEYSDDEGMSSNLSLKKIIGGDILTAGLIRSQIWLIVLIVVFTIFYIANRYGSQNEQIEISNLQEELNNVKFKSLTSSSVLTERCRESRVLDNLKNDKDSVLHISDQPPYIIEVPEK